MCALANMNDTQNICSTETFKTSFPVFLRYRSAEIPTFLEGNQLLHSSCPCRKSNSVLPSDTISESCRDEFYIILHLHVSACGCVAVICLSCISSFTIKGAVSDTSSDSSKSTTAQHHDFITVTLDPWWERHVSCCKQSDLHVDVNSHGPLHQSGSCPQMEWQVANWTH